MGVQVPNVRPDKNLFALPGLLLLGVVAAGQWRRKKRGGV
ncbi:MAG: hypothetical protein LBB66_09785 [Desulfovibrio sp.]|nr:hypothetical protein [Desulfovibrio sp.]